MFEVTEEDASAISADIAHLHLMILFKGEIIF